MFTQSNIKAVNVSLERKTVLAIILCLLVLTGFFCFDKLNNWLWIGLEILCLALSGILCGSKSKYPLLLFACTFAFVLCNEVYVRLAYLDLGLPALNTQVIPADRAHPLSKCQFGESYTGIKPNSSFLLQGHRYDINRDGFRSPNYRHEKPANTFRIVVIDACDGEGYGVDYDKGFVSKLEQKLNLIKLGQRHFEIVNCSVAGYKISNQLSALQMALTSYKPDLILFHLIPTWLSDKRINHYRYKTKPVNWVDVVGQSRYRFYVNTLFVCSAFTKIRGQIVPTIREWLHVPAKKDSKKEQAYINQWSWTLQTLKQLCQETPVTIYMFRTLTEPPTASSLHHWQRSKIKELAAASNVGVLDAYDLDTGPPDDLVIYPGEIHFNAKGHSLLADRLIKSLEPIITEVISKQNGLLK